MIDGGTKALMLGELALVGAGGEPVDLARTFTSHGVASLPPNRIDQQTHTLETTLPVAPGRAVTVRIRKGRAGYAEVELRRGGVRSDVRERLLETVRHMLRLDEDLSEFYAIASADSELSWVASGAGR